MYMYVYTYTHIHKYIHKYIYIYTCVYRCIHIYIYVCIYVHICIYIYLFTYCGRAVPLLGANELLTSRILMERDFRSDLLQKSPATIGQFCERAVGLSAANEL